MKWLKRIFQLIINPQARFDGINPSIGRTDAHEEALGSKRRQLNLKDILFNVPLVLGILIVLSLFILVLYGPVWAPHNPYITGQHIVPHFDKELDEFIRPPPSPISRISPGNKSLGNRFAQPLDARRTKYPDCFSFNHYFKSAPGCHPGWTCRLE